MSKDKLISIGKGALVAGAGAVLTFITTAVTGADFGSMTPAVVAVLSVFANVVRKWIEPEAK